MKTKEQKKPTVLIVDDEYGKRIKVKVVDTLTVTTGKKLMIVSTMNKERKTLLVETPKKGGNHAYVWNPLGNRFDDEQTISLLLFLKKNDMEADCFKFKNRITRILGGVVKGNRGSVKVISSTNAAKAIEELNELFKSAAADLGPSLQTVLTELRLTRVAGMLYPGKKS